MFGQESSAAPRTEHSTTDDRSLQLTTQIEHRIIDWLARRVGLAREKVNRDSEFAALGIDSIAIVELVAEIERSVGRRLPDSAAFEYASVGELATFTSDHLIYGEARTSSPQVLPAATTNFVKPRFAIRS
jgi:acyl carrier protein